MAWSSRGVFLGRVFLSEYLQSSRISRVISLNVFSLFLEDIFHISAGFRNHRLFLEPADTIMKVMRYIFFALFHEVNIPVTV